MSSEHARFVALGMELFLDEGSPQESGSSELSDFHVEVHTNGKEEGEARSNFVHGETCLLGCSDILKTIGNGESEFKLRVGSSLLHVIARDGD